MDIKRISNVLSPETTIFAGGAEKVKLSKDESTAERTKDMGVSKRTSRDKQL
jgi:hypothetical protein